MWMILKGLLTVLIIITTFLVNEDVLQRSGLGCSKTINLAADAFYATLSSLLIAIVYNFYKEIRSDRIGSRPQVGTDGTYNLSTYNLDADV